MKIYAGNSEPDGRIVIQNDAHSTVLILSTDAIDVFTEQLTRLSGSGDGEPFWMDTWTGETGLLFPPQPEISSLLAVKKENQNA